MRITLLILVLFSLTPSFAQNEFEIQKEIDQALWKPFKKAFEALDGPALNALYADQVLRVTPNGIDTENKFKKANLKRFESYKANNTKIDLDFWFDSRHTNGATSYEVGFYKIKSVNSKGEKNVYGQFHIVLKKTNGIWRITQDWDTTQINGMPITKDDFEKQKPLKFE